jgi:hypothetical protein
MSKIDIQFTLKNVMTPVATAPQPASCALPNGMPTVMVNHEFGDASATKLGALKWESYAIDDFCAGTHVATSTFTDPADPSSRFQALYNTTLEPQQNGDLRWRGTWNVVKGSGTGRFRGIAGGGKVPVGGLTATQLRAAINGEMPTFHCEFTGRLSFQSKER